MSLVAIALALCYTHIRHGDLIVQDPLDRKISFEMRSAPANRVLPELSKVAGVRFEVSALTADDVLIMKVNDVSVLINKIAELTAAANEGEQATPALSI